MLFIYTAIHCAVAGHMASISSHYSDSSFPATIMPPGGDTMCIQNTQRLDSFAFHRKCIEGKF